MSRLSDYIIEKVSKSEIDEALSNPNVRIGCEFEFYGDINSIIDDKENPWIELIEIAENYNEKMKKWIEFNKHLKNNKNSEMETPPDKPKLPHDLEQHLWYLVDDDYYKETEYQIFDIEKMIKQLNKWKKTIDPDRIRSFVTDVVIDRIPKSLDWKFGIDGSLTEYDTDIEISTTPMPIKEFLDACPKMFEIIDEFGIVTDKCGFHIGISLSNIDNLEKSLDVVKLAMFTDEEYIYKFFSGRKDNAYVKSSYDKILSNFIITPESFEKFIDTGKMDREYSKEHYNAINHEHLSQDNKYIEFRYIGGANYHRKWDKIKTIIGQYVHNMVLACDPSYKKKEYLLKIQRIINKIDYQAKKDFEDKIITALKNANPNQKKFLNSKLIKIKKIIDHLNMKIDHRLDNVAEQISSQWWDSDIKPTMIELSKIPEEDKPENFPDVTVEYYAMKEFIQMWKSLEGILNYKAGKYLADIEDKYSEYENGKYYYSSKPSASSVWKKNKMLADMVEKMNNLRESIKNDKSMISEKVSKRDVDIALSNPNVRIGCEFEFIVPAFDEKYGKLAKMWIEWDAYYQRFEAWESSTEEYENAGEEEGYDPPEIPKWAEEMGYDSGDEIPNPFELFKLPSFDITKFFKLNVKEFLPLNKMPFSNYIISDNNMTKSTTKWVIKPDATLGPSGIEIVSPILTIDEYLDICPKMFDFIEKYGATNDSCGFHISISLKNVSNLSKTLDVVKMAMFLDEEYIYNFFKKRRDNDYARSAHKAVKLGASKSEIEDFIKDNIDVTKLRKAIPNTHYEAINIEHLSDLPEKQYIEFRYIGSGDYHKKWNEIKRITAHYIWALSIGNDPEFKKKEYMLKLNRLMLKYDLFTKLKRLDIMDKENKQDTPEYNVISKQVKQLVGMGIKIKKDEFEPVKKEVGEI